MPGADGAQGPQGLPASTTPKSSTITRDANGNVASVTVAGKAAWVISRTPDGGVASLSNGTTDVAVDRAADGSVSGTTVSES